MTYEVTPNRNACPVESTDGMAIDESARVRHVYIILIIEYSAHLD